MPAPKLIADFVYTEELEVRDRPLGIRPGWRKADDEWERRIREHWGKRENRIRKVGGKQCVVGRRPAFYLRRKRGVCRLHHCVGRPPHAVNLCC